MIHYIAASTENPIKNLIIVVAEYSVDLYKLYKN